MVLYCRSCEYVQRAGRGSQIFRISLTTVVSHLRAQISAPSTGSALSARECLGPDSDEHLLLLHTQAKLYSHFFFSCFRNSPSFLALLLPVALSVHQSRKSAANPCFPGFPCFCKYCSSQGTTPSPAPQGHWLWL